MKKFLVGLTVFIIIVLSILIQINLLNIIPLAGVSANIGIILVAGIGLMCGRTFGGSIGAVYGLIIDIIFGKSLGLYLFLYMLTGYACGKIGRGVSRENKTTLVVVIGAVTILFEGLAYICGIIFYNYDFSILPIIGIIIKEVIYNIILTMILFKPITLLAEILNKSKDSYYLL